MPLRKNPKKRLKMKKRKQTNGKVILEFLLGMAIMLSVVFYTFAWTNVVDKNESDFCANNYAVSLNNATNARFFIDNGKCCSYVQSWGKRCLPFESLIWGSCSEKVGSEKICVEIKGDEK